MVNRQVDFDTAEFDNAPENSGSRIWLVVSITIALIFVAGLVAFGFGLNLAIPLRLELFIPVSLSLLMVSLGKTALIGSRIWRVVSIIIALIFFAAVIAFGSGLNLAIPLRLEFLIPGLLGVLMVSHRNYLAGPSHN